MAGNYLFEVKLVGEHLTPDKISSRDVGKLIASIEQMIASIVARDNPALDIDEKDVVVGLSSVREGSYVLGFETAYESEAVRAYTTVTNAISTADFRSLPPNSIKAVKEIRVITRKYHTDTEFWLHNGQSVQLATVKPETLIETDEFVIKGTTTLYGTVIAVGGEDPPRVRLRLIGMGKTREFNLADRRGSGLALARQLGQRLYTKVGLRGTAHWDPYDMSLVYFAAEELTEYRETRLSQALESLSDLAGQYYEIVSDIDALVSDARGNDEDF